MNINDSIRKGLLLKGFVIEIFKNLAGCRSENNFIPIIKIITYVERSRMMSNVAKKCLYSSN